MTQTYKESTIAQYRHKREMLKLRYEELYRQADADDQRRKELMPTLIRLIEQMDEYSNGILLLQE